ncbi:MAG TPA: sulfotransferase [Acidimicrobiales bacterium]|nr:sulfotransferase [Acidimicrobiales bacterium]
MRPPRKVQEILGHVLHERTSGHRNQPAVPVEPGPGPVPACPPGWRTGPPDFVGVGIKKAGTSWWHDLISAHPQVHPRTPVRPGARPPRAKELHFFDVQWGTPFDRADADRYHRYFPRPPGLLVGEWTPRYMIDCWAPAQLRLAAPDAKLLVLLRDPIERFRSGITHYEFMHQRIDHPRVVVEEVEYGRYATALARLARSYPREQVLVLQYERCVRDPKGELERTYRFLGLDPDVAANALAGARSAGGARKVEVPDGLRAQLHAEYEPEVRRLLAEWPDAVDVNLWPDFAHLAAVFRTSEPGASPRPRRAN